MAFQTPITIKKALDQVHRHEYVLPAIQREFVWRPAQIERLFDSLMRGYPIGSFLFWKVERENVRQYKFYDFVLNFHQRDAPHCPPLSVPPDTGVIAVLDGQQRLTALNIGLRGSHASKLPRLWWDNPHAFPAKRLHLNLLGEADENEEGNHFDFRFLTADQASQQDETHCWYLVGDILEVESGADLYDFVSEHIEGDGRSPYRTLEKLHSVIHKDQVVAYFAEDSQDLDKVLNIFIRTNSGGTILSYSDLLLSIATAQWDQLDARKEIHGLVDELNAVRGNFNFTKDFVLKAGLMLSDIGSVGFKVTNFNHDNMSLLQDRWHGIADALRTTAKLVSDFGFSGASISAINSLLPIAYYVHHRALPGNFLHSDAHQADRNNIRQWLIRSLLKSGVWGSGLDTLLTAIRGAIKNEGAERFPLNTIYSVMRARGRRMSLEEEEIQDLIEIKYGDKRVFALLSLLYPFVDFRNEFHVDHIFPKSRFTDAQLARQGFDGEQSWQLKERVNRLANLQLLDGPINRNKSDRLPLDWMESHFSDNTAREAYVNRHDLGAIPEDLKGFHAFYEARRERLLLRLKELLGDTTAVPDTTTTVVG